MHITSQVGQSILGSNFSTNLRNVTFFDFSRYPGFLMHVIAKKIFVNTYKVINVIVYDNDSITIQIIREFNYKASQ